MGDYGRLFLSIPNTGSRAVVTEIIANDTRAVSIVGTQNHHQGLGTKGSLETEGTGGSRGREIPTSGLMFRIGMSWEGFPTPKMVKGWEKFKILKG